MRSESQILKPAMAVFAALSTRKPHVRIETRRFTVFNGQKIDDRERDGMLAVLTAIKAALARAKEKASGNGADKKKYAGILHHMSQPKFRDMKGHYGTVKFLLKNDEEFNPGPWYMKSEFGTAPPNVNKQKSFVGLRNRLIKYDAENDVADKFVWKWWSP